MADLNNSEAVYAYLSALDTPQWKTPASLKRSYAHTLDVQDVYAPLIQKLMKDDGTNTPLQNTKTYRNLVAHYNSAYQKNALLAAKQAQQLMNAAAQENTYAEAAGQGAYNAYMAQRGAALPALMAAAGKARKNDAAAKAAAVQATVQQQGRIAAAAQALLQAQLGGITKENHSQNAGIKTQQHALEKVLNKHVAYERALAKKK